MRSLATTRLLRAACVRTLLFTLLWLALTDGDTGSAWLAAIAIITGVASSLALVPPTISRWNLLGLPAFVWFFLRQSVLGGIDVARRALDPRRQVQPSFIEYETRLPHLGQVILLANMASLLPGSVAARVSEDEILVHVLDEDMPTGETLAELERRLLDLETGPRPQRE
jgi:multicomponent Na+:H+ antiporter subunit E